MIHAGVTFWHIRRYTVNGFYEAGSLALATLALWAFSTFSPKSSPPNPLPDLMSAGKSEAPGHNPHQSSTDTETSAKCNIILLDRPTDDELVQEFVRRGQSMHVHFSGVGDLYGQQAPERVLTEGRNLLASLGCWGIRRGWMDLLQKLTASSRSDARAEQSR